MTGIAPAEIVPLWSLARVFEEMYVFSCIFFAEKWEDNPKTVKANAERLAKWLLNPIQ